MILAPGSALPETTTLSQHKKFKAEMKKSVNKANKAFRKAYNCRAREELDMWEGDWAEECYKPEAAWVCFGLGSDMLKITDWL